MRLKSYYAASVAEAIEDARVELGPEAMLLNSREVAPEQRHLGSFEVVFGITGEPLLPRRSEAVAQLFAPPVVPAALQSGVQSGVQLTAQSNALSDLQPDVFEPAVVQSAGASARFQMPTKSSSARSVSPSAASKPPVAEIPAWKRTLEELVSRQEIPVPVSSFPSPRPTAIPLTPVNKSPAPQAKAVTPQRTLQPAQSTAQSPAKPPPRIALPAAAATAETSRPTYATLEPSAPPELLADELVNLRQQIERVKQSLSASNHLPAPAGRPRELDLLNAQMVGLGFSSAFAQKMGDAAVQRLAAFSAESASLSYLNRSGYSLEHLQQVLVAELHSRFQVKPELGVPGTGRKVIMLVGPPGAGKTTTLVKLAIKYGLERRVPVHLLSLDTVRIGGSEQLATFSRILNVGFDALHTPTALGEALADCRTDQLVLIDCPGYAPADVEEASATAAFLRRNPSVDVQLVLPAFMNASSLQSASQRFSTFGPSKLLFTHLDEVDSVGAILEHTAKSSLPVSFLTDGQGIPQDLQEATKDRFTQGILNGAAAFGAA